MGKLLEMPRKVLPYALCAMPSRAVGASKYVLITSCGERQDTATVRGFVRLTELIEKIEEMGVSTRIQQDVRRTLEAGAVYTVSKLLLSVPGTNRLRLAAMSAAQ